MAVIDNSMTDEVCVSEILTADQMIGLVLMHGTKVGGHSRLSVVHKMTVNNIELEVNSQRKAEYCDEYYGAALSITQTPLSVAYKQGQIEPISLNVTNADRTIISVLNEQGPWDDALHIMLTKINRWAAQHDVKDQSCMNPHEASILHAERVFADQSLPDLPLGFTRTDETLIKNIIHHMERDESHGNLHVEGFTIQTLPNHLTIRDSLITIVFRLQKHAAYSRTPAYWACSSLTVISPRGSIGVNTERGSWDQYVHGAFESIRAWLDTQISPEKYDLIQREKELASAAALFPQYTRQTEDLAPTASEQVVETVTKDATGDGDGQDILAQRDFLMQRLSVENLPAPSHTEAHTRRGHLRAKLTGKQARPS